MNLLSQLVVAGWLTAATSSMMTSTALAAPPDTAGFVRVTPADIRWVDIVGGHGAQFAQVLGDQSKPGLYVVRVKFPPHLMDTPHWHPNDRYVTVLQGTWYTGTGPIFDPARSVPLGPGSVMKHPGKGVHWDGSAGDETVIVQIIGIGPSFTTQVDPKGPDWVELRSKPTAQSRQ